MVLIASPLYGRVLARCARTVHFGDIVNQFIIYFKGL
jgi:hypothetical protein